MHNPLVTVVLPVYNVEAYLDRCVNSVLAQTYTNLEILLVDDGSPDNCPTLCEKLAATDNRIKVIHKENAGLGMARNTGIENATGHYICFFDSDDYVAPDTIEKCVHEIRKTQADVVLYGYHNVNSVGNVIRTNIPNPVKTLYSGEEVRTVFLPDLMYDDPNGSTKNNLWMSMCGALFSMDLIRRTGWRLVSERQIIAEDVFSLTRLYSYVNKITILPEAFYFYCENGSSLTRTYRPDRFSKIKQFYTESLKQAQELGCGQAVNERLAMIFLSYTIAALKQEAAAPRSARENLAGVKAIILDDLMQSAVRIGFNPNDGKGRKLLIQVAKYRLYWLCYAMLKAKG